MGLQCTGNPCSTYPIPGNSKRTPEFSGWVKRVTHNLSWARFLWTVPIHLYLKFRSARLGYSRAGSNPLAWDQNPIKPPPPPTLSRLIVARFLCRLLLYPPSVSPAGLAWASWREGGGPIKDDSKKSWDSYYMLFPLRSKCFIFVPGILENMFFICGAERRGERGMGLRGRFFFTYVRLYNVHVLYNAGSVIVNSS